MTWIKEEALFNLLLWLSPLCSCIIITTNMCEGYFLSPETPVLVFYRDDDTSKGGLKFYELARSGHAQACQLHFKIM